MTGERTGICLCGCGQKTNISKENDASADRVKGRPALYILGHSHKFGPTKPMYKVDPKTACWHWLGAKDRAGYGKWRYLQTPTSAHRAMWQRVNGPLSKKLDVDHLCNQRDCINPKHLEPVTTSENMKRAVSRGAQFGKPTPFDEKKVIKLYADGWSCPAIGEFLGVNKQSIRLRLIKLGIKLRSGSEAKLAEWRLSRRGVKITT